MATESAVTQSNLTRTASLQTQSKVKKRIRWTNELHNTFESAVQFLGGPRYATPKGILDYMNGRECEGSGDITIMHVKSHLQKYRITLSCDSIQRTQSGEPSHQIDITNANRSPRSTGGDPSNKHEVLANTQPMVTPALMKTIETHSDSSVRQSLVDRIVSTHARQQDLKKQIRIQLQLNASLQNQHSLLLKHKDCMSGDGSQ